MAKRYGINYPFLDSPVGDFLRMTKTPENEVRSNILHLLLTRKGSRYYLPDFGTRLYEYIFEMNDMITYEQIENEIRDAVKKFIPNVEVTSIEISSPDTAEENQSRERELDERLFRVSGQSQLPYTAKVTINYTINTGSFNSSDFVIINI